MTDPFKIPTKTIVMCILDGWGIAPPSDKNAISLANTPCWDSLLAKFPHCELTASGKDVGLAEGQFGNSEVGHMTIGCGRTIIQDVERINSDFNSGLLKSNPELILLADRVKNFGGKCHIIGMCSDGGVHGHVDHVTKLAMILASKGVPIILHLILDGRDVAPSSAIKYVERVKSEIQKIPSMMKIGTISGRYYAMDRDNRWERTELAYKAIVLGEGIKTFDFIKTIHDSYSDNITDEFIKPMINSSYSGMNNNDSLIFANYRGDRILQLANSLVEGHEFDEFYRSKVIKFLNKISMTSYQTRLSTEFRKLFKPRLFINTIAEIISKNKMNQLRIAETEKYPHVTYFFNGGIEQAFYGEERILIPSLKIAKYDERPEMCAEQITEKALEAIAFKKYNFILINFANTDMVGHTGNLKATIAAVEVIDKCLARISEATLKNNATLIITSDHGNCEDMIDNMNGGPKTAHSCNPVPFLMVDNRFNKANVELYDGSLKDIAPTILDLFHITKPFEMNGKTLIVKWKIKLKNF